ncbi:MAG: hypothetical protein QF832_04840 [SAR324 cluster bacterium]|nr:hypothetical protein [SAR324 cluster bacterium]MDP7498822.1 hypothetical protein [SAR324 cluster bacterium]
MAPLTRITNTRREIHALESNPVTSSGQRSSLYEPTWRSNPDIKRTLVSMSKRTGMTVSQVADEVLYTGLIEMQEWMLRDSSIFLWC